MNVSLHRPIGVFDAGIGSYAIAEMIRRHYRGQDILYFADRASFPYGAKSKDELASVVLSAIDRLSSLGAVAIVLASNAPSVVVLDEIEGRCSVPVIGVFPPIAEALRASKSGQIAVLGVQSLVTSAEIETYVAERAEGAHVTLVNASPLVELVESGAFLTARAKTQATVTAFMADLTCQAPGIDVCTLSSTHLPWLRSFFDNAAPAITFLDPAETVLARIAPHVSSGSGRIACIATASKDHPLSELTRMFETLGIEMEPVLVSGEVL